MVTQQEPLPMSEAKCEGLSSCAPGVYIGDWFYGLSCGRINPDMVEATIVAVAPEGDQYLKAHKVAGVHEGIMLAVWPASGPPCRASSPWQAAFFFGGDNPPFAGGKAETAMVVARAICSAILQPSSGNKCDEGGAAKWSLRTNNGFVEHFAYFPEYVDEVDSLLEAGLGPRWRLDPVEVAARWLKTEQSLCTVRFDNQPQCRRGFRIGPADEGIVNFEGATQHANLDEGKGLHLYETYPIRIRLEQLGGGPGWWFTQYAEDLPLIHGYGDVAHSDSDQWWTECCPTVILDIDD